MYDLMYRLDSRETDADGVEIIKEYIKQLALSCDNSHGYIRTEFLLSKLKEE